MKNPDALFGRLGNRLFKEAYIYSQMRDGDIPDVYVQDPVYFEKYAEEIKQMFGEGIGYLPYVAIHLRVGSNPTSPTEPKYSENPFYTSIARTGFFVKAIEHFPHDKFIVFSDDLELAKTYFTGDKFAFDESEDDIESFNKLASCHSQIISNSSFGYWAAFLNKNVDKKVVCPSETSWYADGIIRTRVPEDWIQIDP